jgi:glc operon protein GlcG
MTRRFITRPALLLLVLTLCSSSAISAQTPSTQPAATTSTLTYDLAKQIIDAAEAEARRNKWNVVIVVTDAAGTPVMLRRLDGASSRAYDIAMRKAATVVATRLATSAYGEQLKAGSVKEVPNGITFAGGVPIMRGAEFIGAVGTSGVRANEDEQISKAGASVVQ